MAPAVQLRDGIEITLNEERSVVCDSRHLSGDLNVLSHAHGDHLPNSDGAACCSQLTADLAGIRGRGDGVSIEAIEDSLIDLQPAGHVPGSRAAVISNPDTGRRICYTGDICTRERFGLTGFDPPPADELIIESTYGSPDYSFPSHDEVTAAITDWLADTMDRPVILFGYAFGRAQELQHLVNRSVRDRLFISEAVSKVNAVLEEYTDISVETSRFQRDTELTPGDALVLPMGTGRLDWIESLTDTTNAITAGFSGWAVRESYRYQRGFDRGFPLSDHCDFDELLAVVSEINPQIVYTHHGFADSLASAITTRLGIEARALKRHQTTLDEY